MSEEIDKIRSVTLRVAIFFGLTTFTLCIAIFYIESILDDTYEVMEQKDSLIQSLTYELEAQEIKIIENEEQIQILKENLDAVQESNSEEATE